MNSFMNKQAKQVKRSKEIKLIEEVRRKREKVVYLYTYIQISPNKQE